MSYLISLFLSTLSSFVCVLALVPFLIKLAHTFKIVDSPDGKLKIHHSVTPYLGGLGIWVGWLISVILNVGFDSRVFVFLVSISLLMLLGLIDDIFSIKPLSKLMCQLACLTLLIVFNFFPPSFLFGYFTSLFLSIFWILSIINSFNLIDVMDGLTSTVAILASLTFFLVAVMCGNYNLSLVIAAFMGAVLGFFKYNFPPAKIYLGDSGSLMIGGFFALIPFLIKWDNGVIVLIQSTVILFIPVAEILSLVAIRSYKGIPFYNGSPHHFSHYLKRKDLSVKQILLYVFIYATIASFLVLVHFLHAIGLLSFLSCVAVLVFIWCLKLYRQI